MPDTSKLFFVMTNALLTAKGGVLMQKDSNGDLHSCTYHSTTFSPTEWNYNIYDRALLVVIQALKEWRHYLTRMEHPVTVITNHKNLGYFKQSQDLTHWQARWWLFLQEYNIKWGVEKGIDMGLADTLSWKDEVDTSSNNQEIILLKEEDQGHHIWALDLALATKISESSPSDPIISKALVAMNNEAGNPWLPRTNCYAARIIKSLAAHTQV